MFKVNIKQMLISIGIPLILVGGLTSLLTMNSMQIYSEINQPKLSPPGWLFPIVWTILFILMGISSYIVWNSNSGNKLLGLTVYAAQLIVNFTWSLVFFNGQKYNLAVFIILILLGLIILNIYLFSKINKLAGWLLVPYLLWVAFATYLNIAIAILN